MEQAPGHDDRRHNEQTKDLVAPVKAPLLNPPVVFGELLKMRFDAVICHGVGLPSMVCSTTAATRQYRRA